MQYNKKHAKGNNEVTSLIHNLCDADTTAVDANTTDVMPDTTAVMMTQLMWCWYNWCDADTTDVI